jgi:putative chitinase
MIPDEWKGVLRKAAPGGKPWIIDGFADALPHLGEFGIDTKVRQQHFIAQCVHESAGLRTTVEYASGTAYNWRKDLGNIHPGDGPRFKGRGLIQLTGRYNYTQAARAFSLPFVEEPEMVARFPWAASASAWWWQTNGCNELADLDDIMPVTKRVNGGYNGLKDRVAALDSVKSALA